jgi:quercetin dioxygenase-like cupin family protein
MERVALDDLDASPHAVAFPDEEPRVVKLALDAGESVDPHQHPDREVVVFLRRGQVELTLGSDVHRVTAGETVWFDGAQDISPRALEDSEALLVLAPRAE